MVPGGVWRVRHSLHPGLTVVSNSPSPGGRELEGGGTPSVMLDGENSWTLLIMMWQSSAAASSAWPPPCSLPVNTPAAVWSSSKRDRAGCSSDRAQQWGDPLGHLLPARLPEVRVLCQWRQIPCSVLRRKGHPLRTLWESHSCHRRVGAGAAWKTCTSVASPMV